MNLNWRSGEALPNTVERAKKLSEHIVKIPEWASFTSLSRPGEKLGYPDLRACVALAGHSRSLTPLDPSTKSGFSDTSSFKGMCFSPPFFQYDNTFDRNEVLAWGLLRKTELASHKKILPLFAAHGLPPEEIDDLYSIDNFLIIDQVTNESQILKEAEYISRLKLEFGCIQNNRTPDDGFRIISNPKTFYGKYYAIGNFLAELRDEEHPFVVADRRMPHNLRLSNIFSEFDSRFPRRDKQEFFAQVIRKALEEFPWHKYPLFARLPVVQNISDNVRKTNADFLHWYAWEFVPSVLHTYLKELHTFATHGWVSPQNITIVGIPTDLDSLWGPEITGDPISEERRQKDLSDAGISLSFLRRLF